MVSQLVQILQSRSWSIFVFVGEGSDYRGTIKSLSLRDKGDLVFLDISGRTHHNNDRGVFSYCLSAASSFDYDGSKLVVYSLSLSTTYNGREKVARLVLS